MAIWTRLAPFACLAAACSPATLATDAGPDDDASTSDASSVDAGPGLATVIVLDRNTAEPVAGAKVAFFAPDGALISVQLTDATGRAEETVPPDAMVAAGRNRWETSFNDLSIEVVAGVQPGDTIELGPHVATPPSTNLGTARVNLPVALAGATEYRIGLGCGYDLMTPGVGQFTSVTFYSDCTNNQTTADWLVTAYNVDGQLVGHAVAADVVAGSASTFTVGAWSTTFTRTTFELSNAPLAGSLGMDAEIVHDGIAYQYDGLTSPGGAIAAGAGTTIELVVPPGFTTLATTQLIMFSSAADRALFWATKLAPAAGTRALDLTADLLPVLSSATIDIATPERPEWSWAPDGIDATANIHQTRWGGDGFDVELIVVAPPWTTSPFRAPAIPEDLIELPAAIDGGTTIPAWPPGGAPSSHISGYIANTYMGTWDSYRQGRPTALFGDALIAPAAPLDSEFRGTLAGPLGN